LRCTDSRMVRAVQLYKLGETEAAAHSMSAAWERPEQRGSHGHQAPTSCAVAHTAGRRLTPGIPALTRRRIAWRALLSTRAEADFQAWRD
jgi:hypothetical protein